MAPCGDSGKPWGKVVQVKARRDLMGNGPTIANFSSFECDVVPNAGIQSRTPGEGGGNGTGFDECLSSADV